MLFNSYPFILFFLPTVLVGSFLISQKGKKEHVVGFVVTSSLFFYGFWNPPYVLLLVGSILFNYVIGERLLSLRGNRSSVAAARWLLGAGIAANLGAIAYFKYANFFVENFTALTGGGYSVGHIVLPLAISFFTFQQIAYLVDSYSGEARRTSLLEYSLFVTFFPQLIAGPIVHHAEVLGQYRSRRFGRFDHEAVAVGLTIFFLGLFKKVVLADGLAPFANDGFGAAARGETLSLFEAWGSTLAYTFQIYFDFSGYSDMAIGLARLFGVRLPINFDSPYKASSIIDFWRRWHITLSRFLRDYLYIPLGGNRKGVRRRYLNLLIVMLLGGLWHGAAWTFVAWGFLHGCYLAINHGWRALWRRFGGDVAHRSSSRLGLFAARVATFTAVAIAWVPFRADGMGAATSMLGSLIGLHGVALPETYRGYLDTVLPFGSGMEHLGLEFGPTPYLQGIGHVLWIVVSFLIVLLLPNVIEFVDRSDQTAGLKLAFAKPWMSWHPSPAWAGVLVVVMVWSVAQLSEVHEFLYFQF